ncbi:hypothetical protein BC940DRAFT_293200 [Gongronella butleri]|nr:hypothetical protein BC940DRAFT_293200 [Gongronella butleri]
MAQLAESAIHDQPEHIVSESFLSDPSYTQISLLEDMDPPTRVFEEYTVHPPAAETNSPLPMSPLASPLHRLHTDDSPSKSTTNRTKVPDAIDTNIDFLSFQLATSPNELQQESPSFAKEKSVQGHRRSTTLTLNEQEKTIDTLKKENFGLKMKIYYLEKRLDELSPDQNDNALRENIDLKVSIQTLGHELKKYKKMILELNGAMAILQQQQGMTEQDKKEFEDALAAADAFRSENEQLQKMISEQRMENARLRLISSQRLSSKSLPSSPQQQPSVLPSPTSSSSHHQQTSYSQHSQQQSDAEHYKASWLQARQTIQEQQNTIHRLRSAIQQHTTARINDSPQPEELLEQLRERTQQVKDIQREYDRLTKRVNESEKTNREWRDQLDNKCHQLEIEANELEDQLLQQQDDNKQLRSALDQRDKDLLALESEVEKLVSHSEDLEEKLERAQATHRKQQAEFEAALGEKNKTIHSYVRQLENSQKQQELELTTLEAKFSTMMTKAMKSKDQDTQDMQQVHDQARKQYDTDTHTLETKVEQLKQQLREREVQIAQLESHVGAQQDTMQREKFLFQEQVKELEDQLRQHPDACTLWPSGGSTATADSQQMRDTIEQLTNERDSANMTLQQQINNQQILEQHLQIVRKRNELLMSLLDTSDKNEDSRLEKATKLLTKLNQELYQKLEDRDKQIQGDYQKLQGLEQDYSQSLQDLRRMEQLLVRRDSMITRTLERIESHKERKEVLENVLRRQATEDVILRRSIDSIHGL